MTPSGAAFENILPFPRPTRHVTPARMPVAGLLFDMGGVLYDETTWRRWLVRVLRQSGVARDYREFFRIWDRDFQLAVHRGDCSFCDAFRQFLGSVGLSAAQSVELEAACRAQRRMYDAGLRALPGVKSTLARLQQVGVVLAAVTNSEYPSSVLRERLQALGLEQTFAAVISSFDLHSTKPDPACYQAALEAVRLPAPQVAFVGHDAAELAGATAVGMRTIACNFDPDAQADVFIARFEDLLEVVQWRAYAAAG
jgi:HAD superfamily hydrolase (TIGR01509 family)